MKNNTKTNMKNAAYISAAALFTVGALHYINNNDIIDMSSLNNEQDLITLSLYNVHSNQFTDADFIDALGDDKDLLNQAVLTSNYNNYVKILRKNDKESYIMPFVLFTELSKKEIVREKERVNKVDREINRIKRENSMKL